MHRTGCGWGVGERLCHSSTYVARNNWKSHATSHLKETRTKEGVGMLGVPTAVCQMQASRH